MLRPIFSLKDKVLRLAKVANKNTQAVTPPHPVYTGSANTVQIEKASGASSAPHSEASLRSRNHMPNNITCAMCVTYAVLLVPAT